MKEVYVVEFQTEDCHFIDKVYCVTETEEEAIKTASSLEGMDEVVEAGYEKVEFIGKSTGLKESGGES